MGASSALTDNSVATEESDDLVSGVRPRPILPDIESATESTDAVLRVRAPLERNRLHAAFRAIVELGMRIVRAEVQAIGGESIQTLHVIEADERRLSASRLLQARAALCSVHGASRPVSSGHEEGKAHAKRLRSISPITEAPKWPQ
jgi:hypothetical protein